MIASGLQEVVDRLRPVKKLLNFIHLALDFTHRPRSGREMQLISSINPVNPGRILVSRE